MARVRGRLAFTTSRPAAAAGNRRRPEEARLPDEHAAHRGLLLREDSRYLPLPMAQENVLTALLLPATARERWEGKFTRPAHPVDERPAVGRQGQQARNGWPRGTPPRTNGNDAAVASRRLRCRTRAATRTTASFHRGRKHRLLEYTFAVGGHNCTPRQRCMRPDPGFGRSLASSNSGPFLSSPFIDSLPM